MAEPMRQCPQCGKYSPADRTYCMHCGTTLGIRCPACHGVAEVGSKTCPHCGYSLVQKEKRTFPLWMAVKRHARIVTGISLLLTVVLFLILAAFPAFSVEGSGKADDRAFAVSGYGLMGNFLGAHPKHLSAWLKNPCFEDDLGWIRTGLFAEGLGFLLVGIGAFLACLLFAVNIRHAGNTTSKRLFPLIGTSVGGAVLLVGGFFLSSAFVKAGMDHLTPPVPVHPEETVPLIRIEAVCPFVLAGVVVLVFVLSLLLHLAVFRRTEGKGAELSVGQILAYPFRLLQRRIRRSMKRHRRRLQDREEEGETEPFFAVTPHFTLYIVLLVGSLIFTQALLNKVSNLFFWFVFLLFPMLFLYTLVARAALKVQLLSGTVVTEKNREYTYEFTVENHSPLAFPFVEARVSLPQSDSVRTTERRVWLSLSPFSGYHMKNTVKFRFRGTYDIGVHGLFVYDFFRLFRLYLPVEQVTSVYVLPRRINGDDPLLQAVSDSTTRTVRTPQVIDRLEVSDIRDYRNGDPLKSIHWKLSSKSENFIVKDYNTGTADRTIIYCDLSARFPDEPPAVSLPVPDRDGTAAPEASGRKKTRRASGKHPHGAKTAQSSAPPATSGTPSGDTVGTKGMNTPESRKKTDRTAGGKRKKNRKTAVPFPADGAEFSSGVAAEKRLDEVQMLKHTEDYADMNEYLADGVVELTVAAVLAELRLGHEVVLLWFDRRSDTGMYAYSLLGTDDFETIYRLFGTAPLCSPDHPVTSLTTMIGDTEDAKQLFVISSPDMGMLNDLTSLPNLSDDGSQGSAEVLFYNPEERFAHPHERETYLEGFCHQLAGCGISVTVSGSYGTVPETPSPQSPTEMPPTESMAGSSGDGGYRQTAADREGGEPLEA